MKIYQNKISHYKKLITFSDLGALLSISIFNEQILLKQDSNIQFGLKHYLLVYLLTLLWIFAMSSRGAWKTSILQDARKLSVSVFESGIIVTLLFSFLCYVLKDPFSRMYVAKTLVATFLILVTLRNIVYYFYWKQPQKYLRQKVVYIGKNDSNFKLDAGLERELGFGYEVFLFNVNHYQEVELVEKLITFCKLHKANVIFIEYASIQDSSILNEVSKLHSIGLSEIILESKLTLLSSRLSTIPGTNCLRISESALSDSGQVAKRVLDVLLSAIAIILLLPFYISAAILVKITSKGPILYWSKRVGQDNIEFWFPKFRTMKLGSDSIRTQTLGNDLSEIRLNYRKDPRITRIGKFLRRWSIDEIPQFFLVFLGTMSIVGPRPILIEELSLIPKNFHYRFIAKPGLTGLWQVSGRKDVEWIDRMHQDVSYVESWSLGNDLLLMAKTFTTIISGKGAY